MNEVSVRACMRKAKANSCKRWQSIGRSWSRLSISLNLLEY